MHHRMVPMKQEPLTINIFQDVLLLYTMTLTDPHTLQTLLSRTLSVRFLKKDHIYDNPKPRTQDQLKENTRIECRIFPLETFPRITQNMAMRMQSVVIRQRGGHVEHVV